MTLTATEQKNLLEFGNDSRDFSDYIYDNENKDYPLNWTRLLRATDIQDADALQGLYFEIFNQGDTIMFVIRGTEINDPNDISTDIQMFMGDVPDQLKVLDNIYNNSPIIQALIQDKRVIFTGNSMGKSLADAMAVLHEKESIGNNGYGIQPWIQKAATELGYGYISDNPETYKNTIINYITDTDLVGNAGTNLGQNYYVPGPNNFMKFLSEHDGQFFSVADLLYYSYSGHLPNNFNNYDLNNPYNNPNITTQPSNIAMLFNKIGESIRKANQKLKSGDFSIKIDGDNYCFKLSANKSVYVGDIYDKTIGILKNGYNMPDTPAPEGVTLPTSGKTENINVQHYTSKPQMLSNQEILFLALKTKNIEKIAEYIKKVPQNQLINIIVAAYRTPGLTPDMINIINSPNIYGWNGKETPDKVISLDGNSIFVKNFLDPHGKLHFSSLDCYGYPIYNKNYPMAIDLDGEGIETIDINNSQIYFDVDNDGFREQTGWISKNEAILAIDKNGNGKIDDQSEMFGSTEKTGFEELKELDTNGDGIIDPKDADFNKIRVWQDLNENGVTDEGELKTATEAGIKSILTNSYKMNEINNNNIITEKATVVYNDGTTKDLYDVATQLQLVA